MQKEENLTNKMAARSYILRGETVMFEKDVAELYEVETKDLRRAVRRNMKRFPADLMFEPTLKEQECLRPQIVALHSQADLWDSSDRCKNRDAPLVFTEAGVAMLSGVLKTKKAVEVGIAIIKQLFPRR